MGRPEQGAGSRARSLSACARGPLAGARMAWVLARMAIARARLTRVRGTLTRVLGNLVRALAPSTWVRGNLMRVDGYLAWVRGAADGEQQGAGSGERGAEKQSGKREGLESWERPEHGARSGEPKAKAVSGRGLGAGLLPRTREFFTTEKCAFGPVLPAPPVVVRLAHTL